MSSLHRFAACATTGVLMSACSIATSLGREWTSKAGTTIKAELVRVHLDNVILKKKDGKQLVVPIGKLSNADQEFLNKRALDSSAFKNDSKGTIIKELTGKLVKVSEGKLRKTNFAAPGGIKYLAVYYSAHWCGPCRAFTPDLVDFYNEVKADHPELEMVFVTSDRSEEEWEDYILQEKMPWHSIQFRKAAKSKLKEFAGPGIPCLVLMTPEGEVLSDSYVDGQYVGPRKVMSDLKGLLKKNGETAEVDQTLRSSKP